MIELISTITTKNKGGYAIALSNEIKGGLHSVGTAIERDKITADRLQDGMLCWVVDEQLYYQWINNQWMEFTVDGGEGNSYIYRVTTYEDMKQLKNNAENIVDYGTLCHVVNDAYKKYFYYYGKNDLANIDDWIPFKADYLVHIGINPPSDKKALWVDTRNYGNYITDKDFTIPTFIDTDLVTYLKAENIKLNNDISVLQERLNNVEKMIQDGWLPGEDVDSNTYIITEDGSIFVTEEGERFITEESKNLSSIGTYIISENGDIFITEDGDKFILEDD